MITSKPQPLPHCRRPGVGFSLLEVLVVAAIIAVVVSGVYGIYESSVDNSKMQQMRANQKAIQMAIEQFHGRTSRYPTSLDILTRGYLSSVPDDPTTDYQGNDWMVIGPNADPRSAAAWRPATSPPGDGIFDVRSSSSL